MGLATELFPRGIEVNNPKLRAIDKRLNITGFLKRTYQSVSGKSRPYVSADVITDDVITWLRTTTEPFFCWAHYMDVHHPCFPPAEIRRRFGIEDVTAADVSDWYSRVLDSPDALTETEREHFEKLYKAAVAYVDEQIARIVEHLQTTDRWSDTLVIITSDHGELFGEYGSYGKPVRMYDELLRVPLIIVNGPESLRNIDSDLLSLLDIPPLIHEILGIDIPDAYEGQLPLNGSRSHVLAEHQIGDEVVVGARNESKLFEYNGPENESGGFAVGSRKFDPVTGSDETLLEFRDIVQHRLETVEVTAEMPALDSDVEERLGDLGYL